MFLEGGKQACRLVVTNLKVSDFLQKKKALPCTILGTPEPSITSPRSFEGHW